MEMDPIEKGLLERLEHLKNPKDVDEAEVFGKHVAARRRTFNPRQYAMACLQIEKVLVDVQFPPTQDHTHASYSTSPVPSQHPSGYYNY